MLVIQLKTNHPQIAERICKDYDLRGLFVQGIHDALSMALLPSIETEDTPLCLIDHELGGEG